MRSNTLTRVSNNPGAVQPNCLRQARAKPTVIVALHGIPRIHIDKRRDVSRKQPKRQFRQPTPRSDIRRKESAR